MAVVLDVDELLLLAGAASAPAYYGASACVRQLDSLVEQPIAQRAVEGLTDPVLLRLARIHPHSASPISEPAAKRKGFRIA